MFFLNSLKTVLKDGRSQMSAGFILCKSGLNIYSLHISNARYLMSV